MRSVCSWLSAALGLPLLLASGAWATPVTILYDLSPNTSSAPWGGVTATGLGGAGAFGASSPHNVITDPSAPTSGTGLQDLGTNLDFGTGISCGTNVLGACDTALPGPSEDAMLFDFLGSVTMDSITLGAITGGDLADGYYWSGSSWVQFFDDANCGGCGIIKTNVTVAGPGTAFRYLLVEVDGNDSGSLNTILDPTFRVKSLNNVAAALPEPGLLPVLGLLGLAVRRRALPGRRGRA